jgi:ornithine cyclodeaminase/alanine dehydrogenase-like protein (mu-crystallin family)
MVVAVLVLTAEDVEAALDLDELRDAVAAAMVDLSAGRASMPSRIAAQVPERHAILAAMPAYLPSAGALTTKLVSLFPENRDRPTHQALIACFDPETGTPLAVMDGRVITEARTAAAAALSARVLGRAGASVAAVIGTGAQARAHALALARDQRLRTLFVAGRRPDAVAALVSELAPRVREGLAVEAASSIEAAVRAADVVAAATHADAPVVRREWLRAGAHVSSVGFNTSGEGEVDQANVIEAALFVESRESALTPPPTGGVEIATALASGAITKDHIRAEIGEVIAGTAPGRRDDTEISLYKSVGVAVQDAAAAALVLRIARERGLGTEVSI